MTLVLMVALLTLPMLLSADLRRDLASAQWSKGSAAAAAAARKPRRHKGAAAMHAISHADGTLAMLLALSFEPHRLDSSELLLDIGKSSNGCLLCCSAT